MMTPQRAKEIWNTKGPFGQFDVTPEENESVGKVWDTLPGSSSWVTALLEIANGRIKEPLKN